MLKKTVTYKDFNGEDVTEDFFFNLNKAELIEIEMSYPGGFGKHIQAIAKAEDKPKLVEMFKKLLLTSYGVKSDDGKKFLKNQILRDEFEASTPYSDIFMELMTNEDFQTQFLNGVMPANLSEDLAKLAASEKTEVILPEDVQIISRADAIAMDSDELMSKLATGRYRLADPTGE